MTGLIIQPIIGYFLIERGQIGSKKTLFPGWRYFGFSRFILHNALWIAAGMLWLWTLQ
jgi:hypothetical protein